MSKTSPQSIGGTISQPHVSRLRSPLFTHTGTLLGLGILVVTVFAGLYPMNFSTKNKATQNPHTGEITFNSPSSRSPTGGIAYTTRSIPLDSTAPITLSLTVTPFGRPRGLAAILCFSDNGPTPVFSLCQWQDHLALFRRDEQAPKGYREIGLRHLFAKNRAKKLTIVSDHSGTLIQVNGRMIDNFPGFTLLPPQTVINGRLVLGNDPTGREAWSGILADIHLINGDDTLFLQQGPASGTPVIAKAPQLIIPETFTPLRRLFLIPVTRKQFTRHLAWVDLLVNVIGFVPASLVFFHLARLFSDKKAYVLMSTVGLAFLLSLSIETVQIFLPGRTSSSLDLICNTLASLLTGAIMLRTNRPHSPVPSRR